MGEGKGGCGCGGSSKSGPSQPSRQIIVPEGAYADIPMHGTPPVASERRRTTVTPPVRNPAVNKGGVWYLTGPGMPIPGC